MPALGMAQESGVLIRWLVAEGGTVVEGDPLMEVETDKAVVEVPATASGTLARVAYHEGAEVAVGTVLAVVLAPGEVAADVGAPGDARPLGAAGAKVPAAAGASASASLPVASLPVASLPVASAAAGEAAVGAVTGALAHAVTAGSRTVVLASPKAKRLARERGLDLARIRGSGPAGAVRSTDLGAVGAQDRPAGAAGMAADTAADTAALGAVTHQAPRVTAWLRATVDASGLREFVERVARSNMVTTGTTIGIADVLTRAVAAGLARDRIIDLSTVSARIDEYGELGGATTAVLHGRQLGSMLSVATARARVSAAQSTGVAPPQASAASTSAADGGGQLRLDVVDRSTEQLERSPTSMDAGTSVRVTLGPIVESVTVRAGAPSARVTATLQLDYDAALLDDARAAAVITYVGRLLGDPFALAVHG